jgi:hypothetical protein
MVINARAHPVARGSEGKAIAERLRAASKTKIVFTTYQSDDRLAHEISACDMNSVSTAEIDDRASLPPQNDSE